MAVVARISRRAKLSPTSYLLTVEHCGSSVKGLWARCALRWSRDCMHCNRAIEGGALAYSSVGGPLKGLRACLECVEEGTDTHIPRPRHRQPE